MRDRIRRTIARHVRHLSTAIVRAAATRRDVCSECRCPVRDIQAHWYVDHGDREKCGACVHHAHPGQPCQNVAYLDPCGCLGEVTP